MPSSLRTTRHRRLISALVELRKDAGLTQIQLAARLRRPQSFVAKYEGGERRIDVIEFVAIVEALGGEPSEIIKRIASKAG